MKQRILAILLSLTMMFTLVPTAWAADGKNGEATTTVEDVAGNEWTFTTSTNQSITMVQGENRINATVEGGTLTFTGTGAMPVLNDSTDAVSGTQRTNYPWKGWNESVTKIVIGDGITGVGAKSFIAWPDVSEVTLGKDVATIGAGAFAQLKKCSTFTVDSQNTFFKVDNGILYSSDMSKLYYYPITKEETTFDVPDSVMELGYNAICRNASLQTITFTGNNPLRLGFGSLFGNTALTRVNLGRDQVTFDGLVFNGDNALKVVYCNKSDIKAAANKLMGDAQSKGAVALLQGGKIEQTSEDGYLYAVDNEGAIIFGYTGSATELTIPDKLEEKSVMMIAANAFANSDGKRNLIKVTIPASVTVIGQYAFVGWKDYNQHDSNLKDVTILGNNVEVGNMAFARHNDLRIDMTKVTNLTAEENAFNSVSKIIVAASTQKALREALAENKSLTGTTKIYVNTDQNNNLYWYYVNGAWSIASSGNSSLEDDQGLKYTVKYSVEGGTTEATAAITGYENKKNATELVIPKTLPFTDAAGNTAQATVVSIDGLRGKSDVHIKNGIKTLTIAADLDSLNTTFVYWDDLETINVTGNVKKLINCFGGGTSLKQVYFGDQDQITFGPAAFGNNPSLNVIDLSGVKSVKMESAAGYSNRITDFYGTSGTTVVYVGSNNVYQAINKVTFPSNNITGENATITKSGFSQEHNIIAITNGGSFGEKPTSNTALAEPSKAGCTFTGWYDNAGFSGNTVTTAEAGKTYYAKWAERQLSGIEVTAKNATVPYNTVLSADDFTVTAAYDNGEKEEVTGYTISPTTALTTLGENTVTVTYQGKTADCAITVVKATQTAPVAPTLKTSDYTSITLNAVANNTTGAKAEYSKDGGKTWQASPEFTGLTAGTTYTFSVRYAETDTYAASAASTTAEFSTLRHSSGSSNPTYSVTTPSKSENGGVAVSSKNARKGDAVTVTVTPDAGYQLDKLTVTDKNGNVLKLTDKGDGKYSFTMPDGKVEIKAVFAKKVETSPFDDVSADAYYNQAVQWAQEKGITDGISSNLFGPKQPCTRSQIVTFLWRAAGSPEPKGTAAGMTDVVPGSYYAKAVAWAVENGITTGTAEGTFSPDATCTRAQAVTFLARAQNAKATGKTAFSDVPADSYFADAVAWAQANGVTTGTSETTFSPDSDCTRAQIVTFLYRANQGT